MRFLIALMTVVCAISARGATPTFGQFSLNQFRTNGNFLWIKPGSLQTNNQFYGAIGVGTLASPSYITFFGTNVFMDSTGSSEATMAFVDPYLVFDESISVPGINLNGVFRTTWPSGGAGDQTPWLQDINAATYSLTNMGFLVQTGANGVVMQRQTVKRPVPGNSHGYDAQLWHYGGPSNRYWGFWVGSLTNSLDPVGNSFDGLLSWGFNSPNFSTYDAAGPSLNYGFEDNYVTALGVRQMEHYMNVRWSSTVTHPRPWGWSIISNSVDGNIDIHHSWNIEQMQMNASNELPAITFDMDGTNAIVQTFAQGSQASFVGNVRPNGDFILDNAGRKIVGMNQFGMSGFGTSFSAASNSVLLLQGASLGSAPAQILVGTTNSYAGFRWNNLSNRMEYSANAGPVSLANLSWRAFNDFSIYQGSWNTSVSLGGTAGDTSTLGFWTNNNASGIAYLEVTAVSSANGDTMQRWTVPITFSDQQGSPSTWFEVLPDVRAGRFTTNHIGVSLDVSGSTAANAMNLRLRRVDASGSATVTVTVNAWANTPNDVNVRFFALSGTGTGGTVSALYRHTKMTQINGLVGINTNSPSDTLFVSGGITSLTQTNKAVTDAIPFGDANGNISELTIGSGLSLNTGTKTLSASGGSGDTNGISYANVAWPAYGVTGNYLAWLKYTNGFHAITATNNGDAGGTGGLNIRTPDNRTVFDATEQGATAVWGNGAIYIGHAPNVNNFFASSTDVTMYAPDGTTPQFVATTPGFPIVGGVTYDTADINAVAGGIQFLDSADTQIRSALAYLTAAGVIYITNGSYINPILGSTDGSDAPAGTYGECLTNTLASGSAISLTTDTTANITSLSLTAGDWYIQGVGAFNPDATTTTTYLRAGISTTSATLGGLGQTAALPFAITLDPADIEMPTPVFRIKLTSTTTVYLVVRAGFGVSTMTGYGRLFAWRER